MKNPDSRSLSLYSKGPDLPLSAVWTQCSHIVSREQSRQELVSMIEDKEDDIEKFARKLDEFNQQIAEYQARAKVLVSNAKMDVI